MMNSSNAQTSSSSLQSVILSERRILTGLNPARTVPRAQGRRTVGKRGFERWESPLDVRLNEPHGLERQHLDPSLALGRPQSGLPRTAQDDSPEKGISYAGSMVIMAVLAMLFAGNAMGQSLGLAPAEVKATFLPGQPIQFEVGVSNDGPNPVVMRATVSDLWYNEKNEKIFGPPGTLPHSASNWIELLPRNFTVAAHGTSKVKVTITPPVDVEGGYYAVLFLESKPELVREATAQSKALYANIRLGSIILLTAAKTERESVAVSDATLSPPAANRNLNLKFLMNNNSNTHLFPQPKLAILDATNKLVARAEAESKRFLPGQKDWIEVPWAGSLPPGNYKAILTLLYGQDKLYTEEFPFAVTSTEASVR